MLRGASRWSLVSGYGVVPSFWLNRRQVVPCLWLATTICYEVARNPHHVVIDLAPICLSCCNESATADTPVNGRSMSERLLALIRTGATRASAGLSIDDGLHHRITIDGAGLQHINGRGAMMSHLISTSQTAFLLMDVQRTNARYFAADGTFVGGDQTFLDHVEKALGTARRSGLRVIHVAFCTRFGSPELHPHNRLLSGPRISRSIPTPTDPQFHPRVAPNFDEVIVTRARVSAFHGSDLEVILRAGGIRHLVVCGIATTGVVLSTVCEASDRDYELTVLSDGCATSDEELQRVLMERLFPRYAQVTTVEEWSNSLR